MTKSLLILEDDSGLASALTRDFEDRGYQVTWVDSVSRLPAQRFDYATVDLRLNGEHGLSAVEKILHGSPECRVVVLTGYGSITTAVEAIKKGAVDYLTKPASIETIEAALKGERVSPDSNLETPSLAQVESEYIDYVLVRNQGNISKTAKDIGLHRQSLQRKLRKFT